MGDLVPILQYNALILPFLQGEEKDLLPKAENSQESPILYF